MTPISVKEVNRIWADVLTTTTVGTETIRPDLALGRILAEDIHAAEPYPTFRKSPFDGYAVHFEKDRTDYEVLATLGAGDVYDGTVKEGAAVRLMTGGALPDGTDTIVMQEQVSATADGKSIHLNLPVQKGDNVIPIGEECTTGDLILKAGSVLTAGAMSAAVGIGHTDLTVYKDLRVLFITSGQELVMPGEPRNGAQIYNSNAYLFAGLLREYGFGQIGYMHVTDKASELDTEITRIFSASMEVDIIISTGGVSVGLFDSMPQIYERIGARKLYDRVTMRPGSASFGGVIERKGKTVPILGLSGNPSAAFNAFHLIALPILRRLRGEEQTALPELDCRMKEGLHKNNPVDRFVQGTVSYEDGIPFFTPLERATAGSLFGPARADALAFIPKGAPPAMEGMSVRTVLLKK